jgi:hypothetical protein
VIINRKQAGATTEESPWWCSTRSLGSLLLSKPSKTRFSFFFFFGSSRIEAVDFLFLLNLQTAMGKRRRFGEGLEVALEAASTNSAIFRGRKISYTRS